MDTTSGTHKTNNLWARGLPNIGRVMTARASTERISAVNSSIIFAMCRAWHFRARAHVRPRQMAHAFSKHMVRGGSALVSP